MIERKEHQTDLKQYLPDYLADEMGIDPTQAIRCLNPSHPDNDPSMFCFRGTDGIPRVHCFSCGTTYDLFDVVKIRNGLELTDSTFPKSYELACKFANERPVTNWGIKDAEYFFGKPLGHAVDWNDSVSAPVEEGRHVESVEERSIDFTERIERAHEALLKNPPAIEHFTQRGFTLETVKRFKLGFDPDGYNHFMQDPTLHTKSRKEQAFNYFIPYLTPTGYSYVLSEISDRALIDEYNGKYKKIKGIKEQYFNEYRLYDKQNVIFIVEGAFDAMSVEQAGGSAIGLIGATNQNRLKRLLEAREAVNEAGEKTIFINALDSDGAGKKAGNRLRELLEGMGYTCIQAPDMLYKDFNEFLQDTPDGFTDYIQKAVTVASAGYDSGQNDILLDSYIAQIEASAFASSYPTGFEKLDNLLDGGLMAGLYTIGAVSSLGKTTFLVQVMDNLAKNGDDVIFFSLEMSALEVTSKSLSRLTAMLSYTLTGTFKHAKSTRSVLDGKKFTAYSQADRGIFKDVLEHYKGYAKNIRIMAGMGVYTVGDIRREVERHIRERKKVPVVIIDYLQILQPMENGLSDKQITDRNVLTLKQMSRDLGCPVIAVSSLNRASYTDPISMSAFKESGAVEYTSDVLIGLQYEGMDYVSGEKEPERKKRISDLIKDNELRGRGPYSGIGPYAIPKPYTGMEKWPFQDIEIKIMKNRNGSRGKVDIQFVPAFNLFFEAGEPVGGATYRAVLVEKSSRDHTKAKKLTK